VETQALPASSAKNNFTKTGLIVPILHDGSFVTAAENRSDGTPRAPEDDIV
jgi:hypothetical protein